MCVGERVPICRSVALCAPDKKLVVPESLCGRPLGLQFHRQSGDLYVADAYLGLLRVAARGGLAQVVATEAAGGPFNFLNGLDVDQRTGDVYFTDSSATYRRRYGLIINGLAYALRLRTDRAYHAYTPLPKVYAVLVLSYLVSQTSESKIVEKNDSSYKQSRDYQAYPVAAMKLGEGVEV